MFEIEGVILNQKLAIIKRNCNQIRNVNLRKSCQKKRNMDAYKQAIDFKQKILNDANNKKLKNIWRSIVKTSSSVTENKQDTFLKFKTNLLFYFFI